MSRDARFVDMVETEFYPVLYNPPWWDSWRWWIVRKLGGSCKYDTVKATRIPIGGEFVDRLFKSQSWIMQHLGHEPKTLLIGGKDYEDLMECPLIRQSLIFGTQYNYGSRMEIIGLKVQIIPWMRGMVILP